MVVMLLFVITVVAGAMIAVVCGYDADQILNSGTHYWLQAIPSLYLLDEEKRVILKDAPLNLLIATLHQ